MNALAAAVAVVLARLDNVKNDRSYCFLQQIWGHQRPGMLAFALCAFLSRRECPLSGDGQDLM
jgi:hypothetical protein